MPDPRLLLLFLSLLRFGSSFEPRCPPVGVGILLRSESWHSPACHYHRRRSLCYQRSPDKTSGYEDSGAASKGIVSMLTSVVNTLLPASRTTTDTATKSSETESVKYPASPEELLKTIRDDYVINNYLWTGAINLGAFDPQCRFTDPTLSFTGTATFVKNIQNLRPVVEMLTQSDPAMDATNCRSELISIELCDGYVQTRWNMIGELKSLPWKPRIDVIGRTKFWFEEGKEGWRVYSYDEEWEIQAGKALLQIITPAGTVPSSARLDDDGD